MSLEYRPRRQRSIAENLPKKEKKERKKTWRKKTSPVSRGIKFSQFILKIVYITHLCDMFIQNCTLISRPKFPSKLHQLVQIALVTNSIRTFWLITREGISAEVWGRYTKSMISNTSCNYRLKQPQMISVTCKVDFLAIVQGRSEISIILEEWRAKNGRILTTSNILTHCSNNVELVINLHNFDDKGKLLVYAHASLF